MGLASLAQQSGSVDVDEIRGRRSAGETETSEFRRHPNRAFVQGHSFGRSNRPGQDGFT